jgi:Rrf2 family protein
MAISAKAEYACLAMLELAARHESPRPVRLADIADKHDIPQRFLVQILLQLKGAGLVQTTRGASGGYQLTRKPADITLLDILTNIDPDEMPAEKPRGGSPLMQSVRGVWKKLNLAREKILAETTLVDLQPSHYTHDYSI